MSAKQHKPIFVRAYVESAEKKSNRPTETKLDKPQKWTLVFDCETTIDPGQALRFGFYQVRKQGTLHEEGIFYDAEGVSPADMRIITAFVKQHRLTFHSVRDFVDNIFLKYGYFWRGAIVGFNLPFDLSRLAISHGPARGHMHGGFTFALTENTFAPSVRIKYLSRRSALIDFTIGEGQNAPSRGMRGRGQKREANRGYFIDVKTLAAALTSRGHSLASLCDLLKTETRKQKADDHGAPVTPDYLRYARADVQATWECHIALLRRYQAYSLGVSAHKILSEASIGKACLQQMGVRPLLTCQSEFPREVFGRIISAYYGGRAEVRIRREVREVRYCDFKSMYPTVNTLMGLWRFVIADGLTWREATAEARDLLARVTLGELQSPETWHKVPMLVRLKPDSDLLPVRTKYGDKSNTIGVNFLTCDQPLWFTIADLIASKILSGKVPEIEEAFLFEPGPIQSGLKPINLLGRSELRIDPERDDLFRRLVDLRDTTEGDVKNAIKTINNATSYGVFIEINRDDAAKSEELNVFGPGGIGRRVRNTAVEEPGRFFNPLLGALITGAARLMLALAERRTLDEGLGWVFCDTDSLAIARPEDMERDEFIRRVDCVIEWFSLLNPYLSREPILKLEKVNFDPETKRSRPLFAFAISAKRYALFNLDASDTPILRKASQHGLGHLMQLYKDNEHERDENGLGIPRWQSDLWLRIIEAALSGNPDRVILDYHPNFERPALSRYGATTPEQLGWLKLWNDGKAYRQQVKPFNFLTTFMADTFLRPIPEDEAETPRGRGRPRKQSIAPVAPFDPDPKTAALQAFDRHTGKPVSVCDLRTYQQALRNYHLSCESKFGNGEYLDRGETTRRHIVATEVRLIGKEANRVDLDRPGEGPADYGSTEVAAFSSKKSEG